MNRYALIAGDSEAIAAYLPYNYDVVAGNLMVFGEATDSLTLIVGEDEAGWTLDDYVLPRLGSGLYYGREVRGREIEIVYSEAACNARVAGQNLHVIESDRYANGTEIPEDKRYACLVVDSYNGGLRSMLKTEAGWRAEVRDVTNELSAEDKERIVRRATDQS